MTKQRAEVHAAIAQGALPRGRWPNGCDRWLVAIFMAEDAG